MGSRDSNYNIKYYGKRIPSLKYECRHYRKKLKDSGYLKDVRTIPELKTDIKKIVNVDNISYKGIFFIKNTKRILVNDRCVNKVKQIGTAKGYSYEQKFNAATVYALTGNVKEASNIAKVAERAIDAWRKEEWFIALVSKVRLEKQDEFDGKLTNVIDKIIGEIEDRLDKGDQVVLSTPEGIKKEDVKVKSTALASLLKTISDERRLIRGEPTSISEKRDTSKMLENLKNEFEKVVSRVD